MKRKKTTYGRVYCKDGFSVSVQAGDGFYCAPRNDIGPYYELELGYPSFPEELLIGYAEDPDNPTGTVYAYVPSSLVWDIIAKHGYIKEGEMPKTSLF